MKDTMHVTAISPDQAAADWIARLRVGASSAEDRREFESWLSASDENRAAYERCEAVWAMPRELARHSEMFAKLAAKAEAVPRHQTNPGAGWITALAASVTAIAVAVTWIELRAPRDTTRVATAAAEQRILPLSDGSIVTLNARTAITAVFTGTERRVDMVGGEAFFDVSRDPARPFIVRIGNSEVRVVGTQFNVRQANGELEVVVREGKVNVIPDSTIAPSESVPRVELAPGNRLVMKTSDNRIVVAPVDPERLTAWRTGVIRFDSVALEDVIADVNRYADKPLVIANPSLRSLPISGRFRVGDTETVRFLLRERFEVESIIEADRVVLR